jgi:hypothetical protein
VRCRARNASCAAASPAAVAACDRQQ